MPGKKRFTEAEVLAQIAEADARNAEADQTEPRARAASFDSATRRVRIELTNGCVFEFPADYGQGLQGASDRDLASIEIYPGGIGLRWDVLDVDLSVPGLVAGVFGGQAWMRQLRSEMGKQGGGVRTQAKANAARANGRKGGRPPKEKPASAAA